MTFIMTRGKFILKVGWRCIEIINHSVRSTRIGRKPRAVPPHEGVPIIEDSYALRRNKTHTPADEQINEVLLKKNPNPKMHYDWAQKSNGGGGSRGDR